MDGNREVREAALAVQQVRARIDSCLIRLRTAEGQEREEINRQLLALDEEWTAAKAALELAEGQAGPG